MTYVNVVQFKLSSTTFSNARDIVNYVNKMLNEISKYCTPSLDCLLFGDDHLIHSCNSDVFLAVQKLYLKVNILSLEKLSLYLSLSSLYVHVYWFKLKFESIINSYFFVNVTG